VEDQNLMSGGCLCGALRYLALPEPETAYYCHCRDCQIGSGSAFHVGVFADRSNFRIVSGATATYSKIADSGNLIERVFCPKCGTPVYWTGAKFPEQVILTVSSLDRPELITPLREIWTHRALAWTRIRTQIR